MNYREERLRVGSVQPGAEKAPRRPCCGLSVLKGVYKKDGKRLFRRTCCGRMRGDGCKLKERDSGWV